ncbi:MAG: hypothetical protein GY841_16590, partial [FCB group bacterium]|nr:hypothetical protein [FCB group bacterium]
MGTAAGDVVTISRLNLASTLDGPADLVITDTINWNGGTIGGSGVLSIPDTVVLNITTTSTLTGRTLENAGTVNWMNGNFTVADGALINNQVGAVFDMQTNGNFSVSGTVPPFNNEGTLIYSSALYQLYIALPINNVGTFEIQNATVEMNGDLTTTGTVNIGDGATLRLNSSSVLDNTVTIGAGGRLDFP